MSLRVRELTPRGSGAVSVLSVSGPGALEAVRALSGDVELPTGVPRLVRLRAGGEDLDESIVCAFSPEAVEVHVHGSVPLVRRLMRLLGSEPEDEQARNLEDLARELLAEAPCEAGARILLDQAEGALTRELQSWPAMGEAERGIAIDTLLDRWRIARWALEPAVVVIAGRVNAGKSTLFNALVGERRAIVDAEPGTTRDLNRERALFGAWPVTLVDTAGERELEHPTEDPPTQTSIEAQGQERSRAARRAADLVLWLEPVDPERRMGRSPPPEAGDRAVLLPTFADRVDPAARPPHAISALAEPSAARQRVAEVYRGAFELPEAPWRPGAAVPFTRELAAGIVDLRHVPEPHVGAAIESLCRERGILRGRLPT